MLTPSVASNPTHATPDVQRLWGGSFYRTQRSVGALAPFREVLLEAQRELKEVYLRGVPQLYYLRIGLDGQVGAVLRVHAIDPIDLFI